MNAFYEHHKDSIRWHYRCFDRILLNTQGHARQPVAEAAGRPRPDWIKVRSPAGIEAQRKRSEEGDHRHNGYAGWFRWH
jgi:hypothetical protein